MGNWCIFIDQKCLAGHCATVPGPIFKILFSGVGYLSRLLCLAFTMSHSMCGDLPVPSKGPAEKVFTYTYKSLCIFKIKSLMASIRDSNNSYRLYLSYKLLWAAMQPVVMTLYQFQFCPDLSGHPVYMVCLDQELSWQCTFIIHIYYYYVCIFGTHNCY